MSRGRDGQEFSPATVREIRRRAGHRCCRPDCLVLTSGGADSEACHIFAAALDSGPRGRGGRPPEWVRTADNGILLCRVHHGLADVKANPLPADTLLEWKRVRELSHDLNRLDNDIRNWQPHIGPRKFDGFIWEQLNEHRSDVDFDLARDLDMARIKRACLLEILGGFANEHRHEVVKPPEHMRRTPIAQILNTPLPLPPSTGPVANRTGLVEPPEIAPALELVKGWLAQLAAIGAVSPLGAYVKTDVTVGFGLRPAGSGARAAMVAKNATVLFASSLTDVEDGLVLRLSCIFNRAKWEFSIGRKHGIWSVISHLEPGLKRLPADTDNPGLHEESLAWERLLEGLAAGAQLVGYFSLRAEPQAGPFSDPKFHPSPFDIDMSRLPEDWIQRSLWRVRRILLAFELARIPTEGLGTPLHWEFTPEFFDERIDDECLRGACRLQRGAYERGVARWERQLAVLDGTPRVLRYAMGDAGVYTGFRYR